MAGALVVVTGVIAAWTLRSPPAAPQASVSALDEPPTNGIGANDARRAETRGPILAGAPDLTAPSSRDDASSTAGSALADDFPVGDLNFGELPSPFAAERLEDVPGMYVGWCMGFADTERILEKDKRRAIPADLRAELEESLESPWAKPCLWLYPEPGGLGGIAEGWFEPW